MLSERQFRDKYTSSAPERIWCLTPVTVRLIFLFLSLYFSAQEKNTAATATALALAAAASTTTQIGQGCDECHTAFFVGAIQDVEADLKLAITIIFQRQYSSSNIQTIIICDNDSVANLSLLVSPSQTFDNYHFDSINRTTYSPHFRHEAGESMNEWCQFEGFFEMMQDRTFE